VKVALKTPRVSLNMEEATLVAWRVQPGDSVAEGDFLYEIETEEVSNEFEASCYGVMLEHLADEGDDTPIGDDVCGIDKQD